MHNELKRKIPKLQNFVRFTAGFKNSSGFAAPSVVQTLWLTPIGRTARSHSTSHPLLAERPDPSLATRLSIRRELVTAVEVS